MTRLFNITRHPPGDLALAVGFVVLTQTEVWVFTADDGYSAAVRLGASLCTFIASAALAYRRTSPGISFFVNGAAVYGAILVGFPSDIYQWTNLIAVYSLGAYAEVWTRWAGLAFGVSGVLSYFARFPAEGGPALAAFAAAMWVVAWLAGRVYEARLEEAQLRSERDLSRELAAANEDRLALEEERNRIARELHDIVGHTVNVMVVHAEAGRLEIDQNPEVAAKAFDTITRTGRDALSELDRVLAVLRRDDTDVSLQHTPGIGDLDGLKSTFDATGLDVEVAVSGNVAGVPPSVGLAAFRIIQEALTNTLKHTTATSAGVNVDIGYGEIRLAVADDGGGRPEEIDPGRGILGMQERASIHEGRLGLSTDADGHFVVTTTMRWDTGE